MCVLQVPGLMENRPSVLKGDHLYVSRSSDGGKDDKTRHCEYKGYVHEVHATQVCLGFGDQYVQFCLHFLFSKSVVWYFAFGIVYCTVKQVKKYGK